MPLKQLLKLIIGIVGFLLCTQVLSAQTIESYIPKQQAKPGERLTYTIVINTQNNAQSVIYPDSSSFGESFKLRSVQHFKKGNSIDSLVYELQYAALQDTSISKVGVGFVTSNNDTVYRYIQPVPIKYETALLDTTQQFRDLKPLLQFEDMLWLILLVVAIAIVVAYYVYTLYKKQKALQSEKEPKATFEAADFIDPIALLEANIYQLKREYEVLPYEHEEIKIAYSRLGDSMRAYLEMVYKIPALESTTSELIREMRFSDVSEELQSRLKEFLKVADMVKFAKFSPTQEQWHQSIQRTLEFLNYVKTNDIRLVDKMKEEHLKQTEAERTAFEEQQKALEEEQKAKKEAITPTEAKNETEDEVKS